MAEGPGPLQILQLLTNPFKNRNCPTLHKYNSKPEMSLPRDKKEPDPEALTNTSSQIGEVQGLSVSAHDAVFGEITESGPNYRSVCDSQIFLLLMRFTDP